jgi:hypothetical protein
MSIQSTKSILAKLLATENVSVVHKNDVKTAYFNLESREIVCPVWKDMDGDLYDLLMGHEVGHALHTPREGWHDAVCSRGNGFKSILNVCEDSRIERKIKNKYPGLRRSFVNAYKNLFERGFFGVDGVDVQTLNLIDRINLREKIGAHMLIEFNDEETALLTEVQNTETWEDVYAVSVKISDYISENETPRENESSGNGGQSESEVDDSSASNDETSESDEASDEQNESGKPSTESNEDSSEDADNESSPSGDEPSSITDKAFRDLEESLADDSNSVFIGNLPSAPILEEIIVKNDEFLRQWKSGVISNFDNYELLSKRIENSFHQKNKSYISLLMKEFEMRKSASQYSRTSTSTTGVLETKKIASYRFTNDLFKKISTTADGKNHGVVMSIDFSGSMTGNNIHYAIQQALCLATFCKKSNIPFVVYSFTTDDGYTEKHFTEVPNMFCYYKFDSSLKMVELISSNLSKTDYEESFRALLFFSESRRPSWKREYDFFVSSSDVPCLSFGNTPYIEMVYALRTIANQFRSTNNIEHLNVIILSDGMGNTSPSYANRTYKKMVIVDPLTRNQQELVGDTYKLMYDSYYRAEAFQSAIVKLIFGNMDATVIAFYIADVTNEFLRNKTSFHDRNEIVKKMTEFKKNGFISINVEGFDEYYLVAINNNASSSKRTPKSEKKELLNNFRSSVSSSISSRLIVSRLCKKIA